MTKKLFATLAMICALSFALPAFAADSSIGVYLNGEKQVTQAKFENGRTLLPLRDMCNILDVKIDYEAVNKKVKVYIDDATYDFTLGSNRVKCNDKVIDPLDSAPFVYQGHIYLPMRYIAELTNAEIEWSSKNKAVEITMSKQDLKDIIVKNGVLERYQQARTARTLDLSTRSDIIQIGESAFRGAYLAEVLLPDGLTKIGNATFDSSHLETIVIPDSVESIGICAFASCHNLQTVRLPKNLQVLASEIFVDTNIMELIIPAKVTSIGANIFALETEDNPAIRLVVIPASVTEINDDAFAFCNDLTLFGLKESYAEDWAKKHDVSFKVITEQELLTYYK